MSDSTTIRSIGNRINVETAAWALVVVVALVMRLAHLDAAPLSLEEAREATLAWHAATGQGTPGEGMGYSPFLFVANALLFALCGTSDALARLWPALFGALLTLTPILFQRRIGRVGALAAGVYLAVSPTALFASRQLDGAVVAAVGGMVSLGGWLRFLDEEVNGRLWLNLSIGGLALALSSSSLIYSLMLSLGLAALCLAWVWPNASGERRLWSLLRPHLRYAVVALVLTGLALSTGLGWHMVGLGAMGDLLAAWVSRFSPARPAAASPVASRGTAALFAVLFGVGGLVLAVLRRWRFGVLLGLWAGLESLMPGRLPLDTLGIVLPLAMLAGSAVELLVQRLVKRGTWRFEGLCGLVVVTLWVHSYLMLARYAAYGYSANLIVALTAVVLQILLMLVFAFAMQFEVVFRGVVVGTALVSLAATLSAGWGVAYVRPADPRELLVHRPTDVGVRELVQTLRELSWRETGIPTTLPVTFEADPYSALAWYMRDFRAARRVEVESLSVEQVETPALVTARSASSEIPSEEGDDEADFVGQDFVLRRSWDRSEVACAWEGPSPCHSTIRWLLFRGSPSSPVVEWRAVLWLRPDELGED